ncbi:MAG TPA: TRAP transporter TatT component family protein [Candidatus Kryptonia bacterium]
MNKYPKNALVGVGLSLLLGFQSCGIVTQVTIGATSGILEGGFEAMNRETDLQLASQAIPTDLKLLDGLILKSPDNDDLLLLGAQGYTSYALGFVEDSSRDRASLFYQRARDYGLRILFDNDDFKASFRGDVDTFKLSLEKFDKSDVPAIFWTANAWGNYVNINRDNSDAVADLPKVEAMMNFVMKHDESYFYGGAHLFFGTILGSLPSMFGGDTAAARVHFERALQLSDGKFLMIYYYYARSYAVMTQDKDLFESLLHKVIDAPDDLLPEQNLANAIAKSKAVDLLKHESDFF